MNNQPIEPNARALRTAQISANYPKVFEFINSLGGSDGVVANILAFSDEQLQRLNTIFLHDTFLAIAKANRVHPTVTELLQLQQSLLPNLAVRWNDLKIPSVIRNHNQLSTENFIAILSLSDAHFTSLRKLLISENIQEILLSGALTYEQLINLTPDQYPTFSDPTLTALMVTDLEAPLDEHHGPLSVQQALSLTPEQRQRLKQPDILEFIRKRVFTVSQVLSAPINLNAKEIGLYILRLQTQAVALTQLLPHASEETIARLIELPEHVRFCLVQNNDRNARIQEIMQLTPAQCQQLAAAAPHAQSICLKYNAMSLQELFELTPHQVEFIAKAAANSNMRDALKQPGMWRQLYQAATPNPSAPPLHQDPLPTTGRDAQTLTSSSRAPTLFAQPRAQGNQGLAKQCRELAQALEDAPFKAKHLFRKRPTGVKEMINYLKKVAKKPMALTEADVLAKLKAIAQAHSNSPVCGPQTRLDSTSDFYQAVINNCDTLANVTYIIRDMRSIRPSMQ